MKVILLQNITKLGQKYDIKEVSTGYAQNFLFPKKLALATNDPAAKQIQKAAEDKKTHNSVAKEKLIKIITDAKGETIALSGKTNEQGHLYAAITKQDIQKAASDKFGVDVPEEYIEAPNSFKEVGEYEAALVIGKIKAPFTIKINSIESS